ncbi:hemocyte protein-glutamine gamma-glutamyltransferase-like protein [Leptotrombidium deliense]|uniref:Hemocyte protein-glutamine gamma-glutamyltransferase-like protein n=1 Tax=Leptotrombidium deliense TaxID=299467 RepID=A0A443RYJ1_9ACAR|nr:hemocyte protein-glutamine gamma-glutamyltransferase-like protein [Leptotrombidium deliense]
MEGSYEERESYKKAAKSLGILPVSLNASLVPKSGKRDVFIKIKTPTTANLGDTFSFRVILRNASPKSKKVLLSVVVSSVYYSDSDAYTIYSSAKNIQILKRESQTINYLVKPEDYISKLIDFNTIRIEVVAKSNKGVEWTETKFAFEELRLSLKYPKSVPINKHFKLEVHFQNPLKVKLTNCRFNIEGKRLDKKTLEIKNVAPGAMKKVTFTLIATQALQENIVITFHSNELGESQSMAKINIVGKRKRLFAKLVPLSAVEKRKDKQTFKNTQMQYEQYQKEQQMQFAAEHIQQSVSEEVTSNNYGRFLIFF